MFRLITKLFKTPCNKRTPPSYKDTPVNIKRLVTGKIIEDGREVYIDKDARLEFLTENKRNIFFTVRTSWLPRDSKTEAKEGDVVYFSKEEFKKITNG